eukprot:scaffold350_cov333-Pavlova_lutheri.AAC.30
MMLQAQHSRHDILHEHVVAKERVPSAVMNEFGKTGAGKSRTSKRDANWTFRRLALLRHDGTQQPNHGQGRHPRSQRMAAKDQPFVLASGSIVQLPYGRMPCPG